MLLAISPYYKASFFQFFGVFFSRLFSGELFRSSLYIDDVQVIVFSLIAISGSFIGVFLVLKKKAMYANAVSHTVLFGLVCVCLFTHQLTTLSLSMLTLASVSTALLTGFLIYFIRNIFRVSEDASTALVFSLLFSLSLVFLVFLTRNAHIGTELVMGNADALVVEDIFPIVALLAANLLITCIGFRYFVSVSFDSIYSFSIGIPTKMIDYLIVLQLSGCLVSAFKAVGVLLSLAYLLIPGLIAKIYVRSVKEMLCHSLLFGLLVAILAPACSRGVLTSFGVGLSTAGISVVLFLLLYFLVLVSYFSFKIMKRRQHSLNRGETSRL